MTDQSSDQRKLVLLEKCFLKNFSFESPKAPAVFTNYVDPEKLLNIQSTNSKIDAERMEVTLTLAVRAVREEDMIFHVKVVQAGEFRITGYSPTERLEILGAICPEMLFPFARNTIDAAVRKGGLPDILLRPVDFATLFEHEMLERAGQGAAT